MEIIDLILSVVVYLAVAFVAVGMVVMAIGELS